MPARSNAQRRFIYGVKGKKFAEEHHFDNPGKLPERVKPKKKVGKKKKSSRKKSY
jgi:DNA-binding sugar fermentation-stimulating protein